MQLTYTPSLEDFIDAQRAHAWRKYSPSLERVQRIFEPVLGFLLLGLAYVLFRQGQPSALILIEVLLGFYVLLRERVIAPWLFRRAYRRRHAGPEQPAVMEFTPEHIHCVCAGRSDVTIQWPMVRGYLDKPKTILLYTAPGLFLYLPKNVLSERQGQELLALLVERGVPNTYPR